MHARILLPALLVILLPAAVPAGEKVPTEFIGYWQIDLDRTFKKMDQAAATNHARVAMDKEVLRAFITHGDEVWTEVNASNLLFGSCTRWSDPRGRTGPMVIDVTNRFQHAVVAASAQAVTLACTNLAPVSGRPASALEPGGVARAELVIRRVDADHIILESSQLGMKPETVWKRIATSKSAAPSTP